MFASNAGPDQAELLRGRLKLFLFLRVIIVTAFLGAVALVDFEGGGKESSVPIGALLFAITFTYAVSIVSAVFLLRLKRLRVFTFVQMGFDVCLTSGVILVTGGGDSPFGFLYSLVIINAAALLGTSGAFLAAASAAAAYTGLVGALSSGLLSRPQYPFPPAPLDLQFVLHFLTVNCTFFLIAGLASSLVRRLHQAERLAGEHAAERDRLASLHEALTRNIDSALVMTATDGCVTSMNHTAEDLAGVDAAAAIGKDVGSMFAPLRHTTAGRLQFLQSSSSLQPTEFTHRPSDGRQLTLRCSAVPVRDTYGNPIGALYILQDVTALRALEQHLEHQSDEVIMEASTAADSPPADGLLGSGPATARMRELIEKAAQTDAPLLITGEPGTGKEAVARAVHARGPRRDRPFITVDCGAVPDDRLESELFGHAKSGGAFRTADGGTVFLDDITEAPPPIQTKLLRVLQERSFTPLGADTHVTVDVRVIAASDASLAEAVHADRFRADLFYRLNVLAIEVPPLRERRQDIPLMTRRLLREFTRLHGKHVERLSVSAARRLQDYDFPGNVRELESIIERAVVMCPGETIQESHLPSCVLPAQAPKTDPSASLTPGLSVVPSLAGADGLEDNLATYEKTILLRALADAGGVKKRAAELLGINYRSFRHRLQKYGITTSAADVR